MISQFEASIPTRHRPLEALYRARFRASRAAGLGYAAVAAGLLMVLALSWSAGIAQHAGADSGTTRPSEAASNTPVRQAPPDRRSSVPLFLGYVEFDWDGDAPDGVPGFGAPPRVTPTLAARVEH